VKRAGDAAARTINDPLEAQAKRGRVTVPEEMLAHVDFIDAFEHFGGARLARRGYMAQDGVHPNERGTRLLATIVFAQVRQEVQRCLKQLQGQTPASEDHGAGF